MARARYGVGPTSDIAVKRSPRAVAGPVMPGVVPRCNY